MSLSIVILAAGEGKRMFSETPKVLHTLGGKPLLEHVVDSAAMLNTAKPPLVIYGYQGDLIKERLKHLGVQWILQTEQLGTGHAVLQAMPYIPYDDRVLILYGDVPLITSHTLQTFIQDTPKDALGIITAELANPKGFGRIVRNEKGNIERIVEEKDATDYERSIKEINSGIYLTPASFLHQMLTKITNENAQREYYLTDIIKKAAEDNVAIHFLKPRHHEEVLGINDRKQLSELERFYQKRYAEKLMQQGLTLKDPSRFDIRGELIAGKDVVIDVGVIIEGRVILGDRCTIGPYTVLRNVTLGDQVDVKEHCVIEGANIASHCVLGPFARIRPGTTVASHVHIGNFIEIKNSFIDSYTKIHHVGYIGDSELGKYVNIGAGTITCNYDGANKNKTCIGDHAFIGSNSELVAPVSIGAGAYIGAGSTITRDAPAGKLTVARSAQRTIENWQPKKKET